MWLLYCLCGKTISVTDGWQNGICRWDGNVFVWKTGKKLAKLVRSRTVYNHKSAYALRVFCYKIVWDQYLFLLATRKWFDATNLSTEKKKWTYNPSAWDIVIGCKHLFGKLEGSFALSVGATLETLWMKQNVNKTRFFCTLLKNSYSDSVEIQRNQIIRNLAKRVGGWGFSLRDERETR